METKNKKFQRFKIASQPVYVKQFPFVDDVGIYIPLQEYVPEGCAGSYQCIMTKETFIEAYNKWIKNDYI